MTQAQQGPQGGGQSEATRARRRKIGLLAGLGLLAVALILGFSYSSNRQAATRPKDDSIQIHALPDDVAATDAAAGAGGADATTTTTGGPDVLPSPLEKVDTSGVGSGATVDQVADAVQGNPAATDAINKIDDAASNGLTFNAGSPLSPASKLFVNAALPDVTSLAETKGAAGLQSFAEKLAERTAQSTQLEAAIAQFEKAVVRKETCAPVDAKGLFDAVAAKCLYIRLAPGVQYNMTKVSMNITYPVAIVGDPFTRPILDGRKTPRLFNVLPGGFLDLQWVRVYRGSVRSYLDGNYAVHIGGGALVYPGAGANFLGCLFLNPTESWLARDIKGALALGGFVLNLGGLITLTDCHFLNMAPMAVRVVTVIGGDTLTVAGVTVMSGCTNTQAVFAAAGVGMVGLFNAVLGGVGIFSGCAFNRNMALNFAAGAGLQSSIGGGVGIFSGVAFNTNGGLFSMFGVAVKQFLGGGVLINSGVAMNLNFGANIFCGAGPFIAVGAGTNHNSGSNFNINSGMGFLATSGGQNFLGAGHMSFVGSTFSRTFGNLAAYGLGGTNCVDVGDTQIIGSPTVVTVGISATAMLSFQYFMAAGITTIIRSPAFRAAALFWRAGQGLAAYVGAGNLTVIRTRDTFRGFLGYAHTGSGKRQVKYFCQGRPYTEIKKDPVLLKPPRFNAFTPSPKPFRHLEEEAAAADAGVVEELSTNTIQDTTTTMMTTTTAGAGVGGAGLLRTVQAAIDGYDGPTAACLQGVTATDTTGGSLPAKGALAKAIKDGTLFDPEASAALFSGTTDCESPLLGSEYKLDGCTIKDSTLTGCSAPGYLGLATQDAEVCSADGPDCSARVPLGLATYGLDRKGEPEEEQGTGTGGRRRRGRRALQPLPLTQSAKTGVVQIQRADVMVTCKEADACKDARALQEYLTAYLNLGPGAKVSVSLDQLDPLIAGHLGMDPEAEAAAAADAGSGDEGCNAVAQYNVYAVTKDPLLGQQFKAAMVDFNKAETNDQLTAALRQAPAFASACAMAGVVSLDYAVPLADAASNTVGDTTSSSIIPAVSVMDENGLGLINKVEPGQWVSLKMSKFPTDSVATIRLVDRSGNAPLIVASFTPQSASDVVSWQVPADTKPGFYIFSASPASNPAIRAMSSIVQVTAKPAASASASSVFGRRRRAAA